MLPSFLPNSACPHDPQPHPKGPKVIFLTYYGQSWNAGGRFPRARTLRPSAPTSDRKLNSQGMEITNPGVRAGSPPFPAVSFLGLSLYRCLAPALGLESSPRQQGEQAVYSLVWLTVHSVCVYVGGLRGGEYHSGQLHRDSSC